MAYHDHIWQPWRVRGEAIKIASPQEWRTPLAWNAMCPTDGQRYSVGGPLRHPRVLLDVDMWDIEARVMPNASQTVWRTIDETPALTWLLFTRRPDEALRQWPYVSETGNGGAYYAGGEIHGPSGGDPWRRDNTWLGVDVSTQQEADELIHALLRCRELCGKLVVRVTVTERIDLAPWMPVLIAYDWLILQGDVGRKAKPCNVANVRELVGQAREAGVPCWVERLGSRCEITGENYRRWPGGEDWGRYDERVDKWWATWRDKHGADPTEWPEDLRAAREVPT